MNSVDNDDDGYVIGQILDDAVLKRKKEFAKKEKLLCDKYSTLYYVCMTENVTRSCPSYHSKCNLIFDKYIKCLKTIMYDCPSNIMD